MAENYPHDYSHLLLLELDHVLQEPELEHPLLVLQLLVLVEGKGVGKSVLKELLKSSLSPQGLKGLGCDGGVHPGLESSGAAGSGGR